MATIRLTRDIIAFLVAIALILLLSSALHATQNTQLGTIEKLNQDNGFITISGIRRKYSDRTTQIFLRGKHLGAEVLNVGMIVRYSLDSSATLSKIELLGPVHQLRLLIKN